MNGLKIGGKAEGSLMSEAPPLSPPSASPAAAPMSLAEADAAAKFFAALGRAAVSTEQAGCVRRAEHR